MKQPFHLCLTVPLILSLMGCARITSSVVEKERVDQEMKGNRGYLKGKPPTAPPERKRTRRILQTDIELATPHELNPWQAKKAAAGPVATAPSAPVAAPPGVEELPFEEDWEEEPLVEEVARPSAVPEKPATTYTVRKGDTLEKIADKVYGDSKKWRRIFEANRDRLSGPNRIYPGQKLAIPAQEEEATTRKGSSGDLK